MRPRSPRDPEARAVSCRHGPIDCAPRTQRSGRRARRLRLATRATARKRARRHPQKRTPVLVEDRSRQLSFAHALEHDPPRAEQHLPEAEPPPPLLEERDQAQRQPAPHPPPGGRPLARATPRVPSYFTAVAVRVAGEPTRMRGRGRVRWRRPAVADRVPARAKPMRLELAREVRERARYASV